MRRYKAAPCNAVTVAGIRSRADKTMDAAVYTVITIVLLATAYPLLYVISCSVSSPAAVLRGQVYLWPVRPTLMSYTKIFTENTLTLGFVNSVKYTLLGTVINLFCTTTGAYALSNKELRGRKVITKLILFTMLFNAGLIPTYLVVKDLDLINTVWAITLPNAIGVTNFIIMKNTFEVSIPGDIKEAAYMEGASHIQTFIRIILPLSLPIIAVMTIFYSVGHWNEYFNALIYLVDKKMHPLQVILRDILVSNEIHEAISDANTMGGEDRLALSEGIRYSIIVVASLPMVAMYPFFQRFFVKGVMVGAVKG
jgi:putative aldouronate transport system permease protein